MALRFKGEEAKRPKKKRKQAREEPGAEEAASAVPGPDDDEPPAASQLLAGTGAVQTSGTIVMGRETRFTAELAVDDSIVVSFFDRFRNVQNEEVRRVRMVVGESSASLEAPFSCDLTVAEPFHILKAVPDPEVLKRASEASMAALKKRRADEAQGELVTYEKLKASGSAASGVWKTTVQVTERLGPGRTREDVLDYRCKAKSDKFCK